MAAIIFAGILSYKFLPISALPDIDYPTMQVTTFYPGADPTVMASSVTTPLERQLGQMSGLKQMSSTSSSGSSLITLQFELNMNLDVAEQQVQAAINAASGYLPTDLPNPPIYSKVNPADAPIITLALTSRTLNLRSLEDIAETRLAQKISQVSGVGLVSISGGQRPAVRIQVNPTKIASLGISLSDIQNAITNANVNAAKGSFDGKSLAYTINSNDQLLSAKDYSPLIVSYKNNAPVRLCDIANVIDDVENVRQAAWVGKQPAIILNIMRQPGANVIKVADSVKELLPTLSATLPKAIEILVLSDQTTTIRASVSDVTFELIFSIILVILVIFIFLRTFSATIIPSIAVPLSLVGSLSVIYLMGFSLNNITLMALTIATGFVVDDAIVMIENISRYIEEGMNPLDAAFKGAEQIGFTILSLTASLIAVLIPLFFMQDIVGLLFHEFAVTLAVTIMISAFVSLTLTPMLCSRVLKSIKERTQGKFEIVAEKYLNFLIDRYRDSLLIVLKHQHLTLSILLATMVITGMLLYMIPKGFFPVQDTGLIQGISIMNPTISFQSMAKKQQELAEVILEDAAVENISSFIGIDGVNTTINQGRMLIILKPLKERKVDVSKIITRLHSKLSTLKDAKFYMQPIEDLTVGDTVSPAKYQYSLTTQNQEELSQWGTKLLTKLNNLQQLENITTNQHDNGLQIFIEVDRDVASQLGITMQDIDEALYNMYGQRQISTIFTQRNQYHVILEGLPSMINSIKSLDNLYFPSSNGRPIPLRTFCKISVKPASLIINRINQFPLITISFDLAKNTSLGTGLAAIDKVTQELNLPYHVKGSFQGDAEVFQNSLNNEGFLLLAAIIVVYIVLGVLYESYIHPVTIISTLPSACMGALLALRITDKDLNVIAVIGVILLIGIVMKNAIMMIDFALEQQRVQHKTPTEAIFTACILRFRPIMMTTMASMFGAIPLVFNSGIGYELRQPLGITIMGGLAVSQVLTLYTTPVVYLAFDRLATKFLSPFTVGNK